MGRRGRWFSVWIGRTRVPVRGLKPPGSFRVNAVLRRGEETTTGLDRGEPPAGHRRSMLPPSYPCPSAPIRGSFLPSVFCPRWGIPVPPVLPQCVPLTTKDTKSTKGNRTKCALVSLRFVAVELIRNPVLPTVAFISGPGPQAPRSHSQSSGSAEYQIPSFVSLRTLRGATCPVSDILANTRLTACILACPPQESLRENRGGRNRGWARIREEGKNAV